MTRIEDLKVGDRFLVKGNFRGEWLDDAITFDYGLHEQVEISDKTEGVVRALYHNLCEPGHIDAVFPDIDHWPGSKEEGLRMQMPVAHIEILA